ncbi:hypothetical protein BKA70DRAFT_1433944 [Coprinopsis sp. MPI-PUGE-AT-0042]|nr:hypothetical protein BKA70DRAFT_1433944 [Coprinopsis sp. MPI-PUGE-AT-0042]
MTTLNISPYVAVYKQTMPIGITRALSGLFCLPPPAQLGGWDDDKAEAEQEPDLPGENSQTAAKVEEWKFVNPTPLTFKLGLHDRIVINSCEVQSMELATPFKYTGSITAIMQRERNWTHFAVTLDSNPDGEPTANTITIRIPNVILKLPIGERIFLYLNAHTLPDTTVGPFWDMTSVVSKTNHKTMADRFIDEDMPRFRKPALTAVDGGEETPEEKEEKQTEDTPQE